MVPAIRKDYSIFDLNLSSSIPLSIDAASNVESIDLELDLIIRDNFLDHELVLIYESPYRDINKQSFFRLYKRRGHFVLRVFSALEYEYAGSKIICTAQDATDPRIEAGLLGAVLAFWLEMHQVIALHASAVTVDNRSLIFLADSLGGKSSLAASFLQAGYTFLSDDIVPIEKGEHGFLSRPGYPIIKLWPAEANHFFGNLPSPQKELPESEKLKIAIGPTGFGQFASSKTSIHCLYLPQRYEMAGNSSPIQIIPISPRDAVIELLRHSFASRMAEAAGFAAARLAAISEIARTIPLKRLIYPSGYHYLPQVRDALLADLSR